MRTAAITILLSLVCACPDEGTGPDQAVFTLSETELPGVFAVTAKGMNEGIDFRYVCDDGVTGTATVIESLWLAARDRTEIETSCYLQGTTNDGKELGTSSRTLRLGMLEAQALALDPMGDAGLDQWERRALGPVLDGELPAGIERLVWLDERRRLVVQSRNGRAVWARRWSSDGLSMERTELEGADPCEGIPACVRRLFGFFENPQAPDLIALTAAQAGTDGKAAQSGSIEPSSSSAGFLAWGAGVQTGALDQLIESVDLAPTLAAALGVGWTLGRASDGALAWTLMSRMDGVIRSDLIASEASEQVLVFVIDGLSTQALEEVIEDSVGLKHARDQGLWLRQGLLSSFPSNAVPSHTSLGSGLWSGHHGVYDDLVYNRAENTTLDLLGEGDFRSVDSLFRVPAETLHQAIVARPSETMDEPWTVCAGSPSRVGATTDALSTTGPGSEGWLNIGREPGFAELPQAPDWLSGDDYAAWETSIILSEYTQRMITGLQVPGARPTYTITRLPIYQRVAEQFGTQSDEARQALLAVDAMLERLIAAMERREWQDKITVIVTGSHGLTNSDPEVAQPAWWQDGTPWSDRGVLAHSAMGHLTVEAMAFDKRIDNGFVNLSLRDADSQRVLGGVTLTTYSGQGEVLETRLSNSDGALNLPQPNDREVWGVLRAEGYSDLRLDASELQL